MKSLKIFLFLALSLFFSTSCNDFLDINSDPNSIGNAPIEQIWTNATVSIGFMGGSDLHRFASLIAQQFSGQGQGATTQPQEYERYNIQGSDVNNLWNYMYATVLSDLELVIQKGQAENSPHYTGVAQICKAYVFQLIADTWGEAPFSEALKFTANTAPKFDKGEDIYAGILKLLDDGIANIKNPSSVKSPGANSTIYSGAFSSSRDKWEKFANTLKMRCYLHYSKADRNFMVTKISEMVNANAPVMASNADNFAMAFVNSPRAQNSIHQFELDRQNQFFPNKTLVDMMNGKNDPRRFSYFTPFPFTYDAANATFKGAAGGDAPSVAYSRMHTYLRGDTTKAADNIAANGALAANSYTYTGSAPIRMLNFAEYNFIRAEAALYGVPGDAEAFYQAGIRASLAAAGVSTAAADAYVAANGTLSGTEDEKLKKIIEEKFVANYGVVLEPWTDYRRTGYPDLPLPLNAIGTQPARSLFYPQSEIDLNPNAPAQKPNVQARVWWDK